MSVGKYKPWTNEEVNLIKGLLLKGLTTSEIIHEYDRKFDKGQPDLRGTPGIERKITEIKKQGYGRLGNRAGLKAIAKAAKKAAKLKEKQAGALSGIGITEKIGRGRPRKAFNNIDPKIHSLLCHVVKTIEELTNKK